MGLSKSCLWSNAIKNIIKRPLARRKERVFSYRWPMWFLLYFYYVQLRNSECFLTANGITILVRSLFELLSGNFSHENSLSVFTAMTAISDRDLKTLRNIVMTFHLSSTFLDAAFDQEVIRYCWWWLSNRLCSTLLLHANPCCQLRLFL